MKKSNKQLPVKLQEQVSNSGIELTEAQAIASNYAPIFQEVAEQEEIVKGLEKGNPDHVSIAKRARIDLGKICSKADAQKKSDKEKILLRGRFIDGLYNAANGYGRLTQEAAKEIEDHFENMERERIAKLQAERSLEIEKYGGTEYPELGRMSEEVWCNFLAGTIANYEARIAAEKKAEADRVAAELAEKKRIEEQRIENERLKKEAEERERQIAEERAANEKARIEEQAKADAERKKVEARLKKEAEERARIAAELQAKIDAERKAEAEKAEAERLRMAAEEKAAKAPVKNRMESWVESFELPSTDIENPTTNVILTRFDSFKKWAKEQVSEF